MNTQLLPHEAERNPIVFMKDGEVFANSRDVAAFFDKRHDHVLRDIDNLLAAEPELGLRSFAQGAEGRLPSFGETVLERENPNGGAAIKSRGYEMTRGGFTLLAMGFTGTKALKWKMRYIAAFNAMETQLHSTAVDAMTVLNDPAAMRGLLLSYTEKVLVLEQHVADLGPKAEALSRIAGSEGSFCITDAAKTLQVQPKALFSFLRSHRWIYTRAGGSGDIAYQDKLASGVLEHKTTTVHRTDGSEKTVTQVRVTTKGLAHLAKVFPTVAVAA